MDLDGDLSRFLRELESTSITGPDEMSAMPISSKDTLSSDFYHLLSSTSHPFSQHQSPTPQPSPESKPSAPPSVESTDGSLEETDVEASVSPHPAPSKPKWRANRIPPHRRRPRATQAQLELLEHTYQNTTISPRGTLRTALARQLGMSERSVQVWFQNRRAKGRRGKKREKDQTSGDRKKDSERALINSGTEEQHLASSGLVASVKSLVPSNPPIATSPQSVCAPHLTPPTTPMILPSPPMHTALSLTSLTIGTFHRLSLPQSPIHLYLSHPATLHTTLSTPTTHYRFSLPLSCINTLSLRPCSEVEAELVIYLHKTPAFYIKETVKPPHIWMPTSDFTQQTQASTVPYHVLRAPLAEFYAFLTSAARDSQDVRDALRRGLNPHVPFNNMPPHHQHPQQQQQHHVSTSSLQSHPALLQPQLQPQQQPGCLAFPVDPLSSGGLLSPTNTIPHTIDPHTMALNTVPTMFSSFPMMGSASAPANPFPIGDIDAALLDILS
ncbi:hypothetical protein HDU85_004271 [Gaertneriomyces sp. JEL0708]|nr:hypothetical protein HDU85_004271 [Gaertneriomyces sp. JEL0708]